MGEWMIVISDRGKSFDRRSPVTQDKGVKRPKLLFAAFLMSIAFPIFAEQLQPSVFIYGGLRGAVEKEVGNAFESGFGFSAALAKGTRVVVNLGTARHPIIEQAQGNKLIYKTSTASPFLVGLQQEIIGGSRLAAYLTAEAGVLFSGLQGLNIVTIPETTVRQKVPASFIFRGAAGAEFSVSTNLHLFGEAGYLYGKATGTTSTYDLSTLVMEQEFQLDLSAFDICLGLKYYF
jgi:hypothetical protein